MKGATPEDEAKMSNNPKSIKTVTIGISHHNLRSHKKSKTSPKTPVLVTIPLKKFPIAIIPSKN
jgi:hypothetical protein